MWSEWKNRPFQPWSGWRMGSATVSTMGMLLSVALAPSSLSLCSVHPGPGAPRVWEEEPRGYRGRLTDLLLPGVDRIRRMESAGGLPLQRLVGLRLLDVEAGRLRFPLESSPWLRWSRDGAVPAPVVGLALDAALGLSVVSTLEPGDASSSALLSVSHARPPAPGTPSIEVTASVVGRSGDWVLAEALVTDREGRLAVAASHCLRAGAGRPPAAHPPTGEAPPPPEDHATPDPHRRALPPPDAATPPRNPLARPLRHDAAGP